MAIKNAKLLDRRKLKIDLRGPHGNAFFLMATAKSLCKQLNREYDAIAQRMKAGDYENLLKVFDEEFGNYVDLYR